MGELSVEVPDLLRRHGKEQLVAHVALVAETARRIALGAGIDPGAAEAAGWLHDISLILPYEKMLAMARVHRLSVGLGLGRAGADARHPPVVPGSLRRVAWRYP